MWLAFGVVGALAVTKTVWAFRWCTSPRKYTLGKGNIYRSRLEWDPRDYSRLQCSPSSQSVESLESDFVDSKLIPSSYEAAKTEMLAELYSNIMDRKDEGRIKGSRGSLDLLTPGLNPKLEQKVILSTELLFDLVSSMLPVVSSTFSTTLFMFQSMGDAAGFEKYMRQTNQEVPSNVVATELNVRYISPDVPIECIVFVRARNHVGDPVLSSIREIARASPDSALFFLNCDLSDAVTTGSVRKQGRDDFRESVEPVFYFRNIVQVSRPSLLPRERGAMIFNKARGWRIYSANEEEIFGSGSLNRYLDKPVFKKHEKDSTSSLNPPQFVECATFERLPKRDEIDNAISKGEFIQAKRKRDRERAAKGLGGASEQGEKNFFKLW